MSRTTLDIDPDVIAELKHMAAEQRESMSRVTNRLLREALRQERAESGVEEPWHWHVVNEGSPAPGFDPATRDYFDLLDET